MRSIILATVILGMSAPAAARPGFSVALGVGGSSVGGTEVLTDRLTSTAGYQISAPPGYALTTEFGGGVAPLFAMSFNVLGYAALETRLSGFGHNLSDAHTRSWAAQWHTGIRAYPMWHWQAQMPELLQPFEPSVFVGWGAAYQGYAPNPVDEVGWSTWNSWRIGLGVEYFIISYFKVMLDYSAVIAPYKRFIYDYNDSINFDVEPAATTVFHQFFVVAAFQFGPAQESVRY